MAGLFRMQGEGKQEKMFDHSDKKDKISKWYERDILKQLQSLNGKPAAWPFEGIFLKFFLQAISWHRMAFYVGFI